MGDGRGFDRGMKKLSDVGNRWLTAAIGRGLNIARLEWLERGKRVGENGAWKTTFSLAS